MTSVNVTENKYSVSVTEGATTVVTVKAPGPQGVQGATGATGATGAGISAGDKGALTVAANLTDWTLNKPIDLGDNEKIRFGDSQDLEIFHDSNHSNIKNITGNFSILSDTILLKNAANSESFIRCQNNGVQLYHSNSLKLETYSGGFNLTGKLNVSGDIDIPDNSKLLIGTGDDLTLHHDGAGSKIENLTGSLNINTVSSEIWFSKGTSEYLARFITDGSVELYHDGVKRAETTSGGVDFFNIIRCLGGTAPRIQFFGDENGVDTTTRGTFGLATGANQIVNGTGANDVALNTPHRFFIGHASTEIMAKFDPDGPVELYHDNVKKFETTSAGAEVTGGLDVSGNIRIPNATGKLIINQNLNIYRDNNHGYIDHAVGALKIRSDILRINDLTNDHAMIHADADGAVKLYYDNVKKAETSADGFQIQDNLTISGDNPKLIFDQTSSNIKYKIEEGSGLLQLKISSNSGVSYTSAISIGGVGNIFIPDNDKVNFGSGNDLVIVHDGSDSKITNKTGNLLIEAKDSETGIKVIPDGAIELYHDNVKKLETTSSGITVTGSVTTQDMNMSNLNGTANEVDNTKGSWSIQEGVDDLFIINRVSGKKYKFNLTEIS